MKILTQRLNVTFGQNSNGITFDTRRDVNIYETVCKYCADENISLKDVSDVDFDNVVETIENFKNDMSNETNFVSFWIN